MKTLVPGRVLIPLIVASALFMDILDSTVIATSLPQIAVSFGEDPVRLSLAITAYLLSLAVFLPVSGFLADRYGARIIFSLAIVVFTISSVLCGFSQNLPELFGARILQGIGGSMMVPVGRLVILRTVSKNELVSAMAYFTVPALIAPIVGPPLGGFITTYYNWRWIFFINVPIGVLGLILVASLIPNLREASPPRLDLKGWILSALALVGLLFGFENLGRPGLPLVIILSLLTMGAIATALYFRHARRVPEPILDFSLLSIGTLRASFLGGFFFRLGLGCAQLLLPLVLQLGLGLSAFASGTLSLFGAAGAMMTKIIAAPLLRQLGFRTLMLWNSVVAAACLGVFALVSPATPHTLLALMLFLNGASRSLQFTALNTIGYADIEPPRMSASSTLQAVGQQFGVAVGVAGAAAVLHLLTVLHGGRLPALEDFRGAFVLFAALTLLSRPYFAALPATAGNAVSGHRLEAAVEPDVAPALGVVAADAVLAEGKETQPSGPRASSG